MNKSKAQALLMFLMIGSPPPCYTEPRQNLILEGQEPLWSSKWVDVRILYWTPLGHVDKFLLVEWEKTYIRPTLRPKGCLYNEVISKDWYTPSAKECAFFTTNMGSYLAIPGWSGDIIEHKYCSHRHSDKSYVVSVQTSIQEESNDITPSRLYTIPHIKIDSFPILDCHNRSDHRMIFNLKDLKSEGCDLFRIRQAEGEIRETTYQYHREYELRDKSVPFEILTFNSSLLTSPGACPILKGVGKIIPLNETHSVSLTDESGLALNLGMFWKAETSIEEYKAIKNMTCECPDGF